MQLNSIPSLSPLLLETKKRFLRKKLHHLQDDQAKSPLHRLPRQKFLHSKSKLEASLLEGQLEGKQTPLKKKTMQVKDQEIRTKNSKLLWLKQSQSMLLEPRRRTRLLLPNPRTNPRRRRRLRQPLHSLEEEVQTTKDTRLTIKTTVRSVNKEEKSFCAILVREHITWFVWNLNWKRLLKGNGLVLTAKEKESRMTLMLRKRFQSKMTITWSSVEFVKMEENFFAVNSVHLHTIPSVLILL